VLSDVTNIIRPKRSHNSRFTLDENGRRHYQKKIKLFSGIKVRHAIFHKNLVAGNIIKSSASSDASSSIACTSSESKNVLNALNLDSGHDLTQLEIELLKLIDFSKIEIPPHVQRLVQATETPDYKTVRNSELLDLPPGKSRSSVLTDYIEDPEIQDCLLKNGLYDSQNLKHIGFDYYHHGYRHELNDNLETAFYAPESEQFVQVLEHLKSNTHLQRYAIKEFERGKPYSEEEYNYRNEDPVGPPDEVLQEFELPDGTNLVARPEDASEKKSMLEWLIQSAYLLLGKEYYLYTISSKRNLVVAYMMPARHVRMLKRAFQFRFALTDYSLNIVWPIMLQHYYKRISHLRKKKHTENMKTQIIKTKKNKRSHESESESENNDTTSKKSKRTH
jgi:hypothetical protein